MAATVLSGSLRAACSWATLSNKFARKYNCLSSSWIKFEETLTADLRSLSVLSFQRKAKTADGELFGSVTIDEVIRKLRADHDIILESASFATGDRVKQKGLHTVFVRLPITQTEVTFTIDVKAS